MKYIAKHLYRTHHAHLDPVLAGSARPIRPQFDQFLTNFFTNFYQYLDPVRAGSARAGPICPVCRRPVTDRIIIRPPP
jgi:hypothetical protein